MKCIVLAGGSGDRLWPLSRKDYPKQFMEVREHRSLFQETILRNIPFTEEFVILANRRYEKILRGQLMPFQRLRYSFVFEEESLKTALPVVMTLLRMKPEEEILMVSTDAVFEGDYNSTVMDLKKVVEEDKVAVVGATVMNKWEGYNFIEYKGNKVVRLAKERTGTLCAWDCGLMAGRAGTVLDAVNPRFLARCRNRLSGFNGVITEEVAKGFQPASLGSLLTFEKLTFVRAKFRFHRVIDLKTYADYSDRPQDVFTIKSACRNTDVINAEEGKTVILNHLEDLYVVNTRDALYVSKKENVADIKGIVLLNHDKRPEVFDSAEVVYETWGIRRIVYRAGGYQLHEIVVYPGAEIPTRQHTGHVENITVLSGSAFITLNGEKREYIVNDSVFVPTGVRHRIENLRENNLVIMETKVGTVFTSEEAAHTSDDNLVRLQPFLKECLWGGTAIGKLLGKKLYGKKDVGESWELSTHKDGECTVADGKYAGKTLLQYIDIIGRDKLGWKCQAFRAFPLLIKFIDAQKSLSIQVHPDDEYAFPHENEYGKNEMWYIVDAKPNAYIYAGFNRNVTRDEVRRRLENGTIEEVLQKIPVRAGETYFLQAGTVHAIGAGCLLCEIQQSSNVTYRLYDYGRKDKDGRPRELHIEKALDVLNYKSSVKEFSRRSRPEPYQSGTRELLGECKYFSAVKYEGKGEISLFVDYSSFRAFVVVEGKGTVRALDSAPKKFKKGDTFFGVAREYRFFSRGKMSIIAVNL